MDKTGAIPDFPPPGRGPTWSGLRREVQRYLERGGLPALQAERCSHEVIVRCAADIESDGGARWRERAMAEAETVLVGWRARLGDTVPAAA